MANVVGAALAVGLAVFAIGMGLRSSHAPPPASAAAPQDTSLAEARSVLEQRRTEARAADLKLDSAAMGRTERDEMIERCEQDACEPWRMDALILGAPVGGERDHATRIAFAAKAQKIARRLGKDGPEVSRGAVNLIGEIVAREHVGLALFDVYRAATVQQAEKDPEATRGGALRVSGTIVEIRTENEIAEGTLATEHAEIIRFITPLSTAGLFARSKASFVGVFVQEYDYTNTRGGQTKSLLVVGAFDIPENRSAR